MSSRKMTPRQLVSQIRHQLSSSPPLESMENLVQLMSGGDFDIAYAFRGQDFATGLARLIQPLPTELREKLAPQLHSLIQKGVLAPELRQSQALMDLFPLPAWPIGFLTGRAKTTNSIVDIELWLVEINRRLEETKLSEPERTRLLETQKKAKDRQSRLRERFEEKQTGRPHSLYRKALFLLPKKDRPQKAAHAGGPPPALRWAEDHQTLNVFVSDEASRFPDSFSKTEKLDLGRALGTTASVARTVLKDKFGILMRAAIARSLSEAHDFLDRLDQRMMRLEFDRELQRRGIPDREIPEKRDALRILFRGQTPNGRVEVWVLSFAEDGEFLLLAKIKDVWRCLKGGTEEILASIPDVWFDGALFAMHG